MNEQTASQSNSFAQKIEAVLFWKAEPISLKKLASLIGATEEQAAAGIKELRKSLIGRGITVIENRVGDTHEVTLATSSEHSEMIKALTKDELMRDLGKAGLETLSIILYQGPVSRAEIDYIRGVNSQFILRNLLIRGLIERRDNPKDQRSYLYAPTIELISYLGITRIEDLPDYETVRRDIESFKVQHTDEPAQNEVAQN